MAPGGGPGARYVTEAGMRYMDAVEKDGPAYKAFPAQHRTKLPSKNPLSV